MTAESHDPLLQLLDPAHRADPYPLYRRILDTAPLRKPENHLWVFASFADCDKILRHPSSCNDRLKWTSVQRAIAAGQNARPFGVPGFIFLDPPDHTRLRKLVSKAFSPKVVHALEPQIVRLVDDLLDQVERAGRFDAVRDLAHPLPVAVICRLLGVPLEDEPQFGAASTVFSQGVDPFVMFLGQAQEREKQVEAGLWLRGYLRDLLEQRRARPADDLMSALIAVEEAGDQLTEEEVVATCSLLLVAGHETTVNLIGNAVLAMLRHPQHWTALSENAGHASAIVEETLRYDPPVQLVGRIAGEDMEINGVTVPKGDMMTLLLAAANRGTQPRRPRVKVGG